MKAFCDLAWIILNDRFILMAVCSFMLLKLFDTCLVVIIIWKGWWKKNMVLWIFGCWLFTNLPIHSSRCIHFLILLVYFSIYLNNVCFTSVYIHTVLPVFRDSRFFIIVRVAINILFSGLSPFIRSSWSEQYYKYVQEMFVPTQH